MSRIYTVKSNARRDAHKLGLDPEMVKAVVGGFVIDYPDVKIEKLIAPSKPKKAAPKVKAAAKPKAAKALRAPKAAKTPPTSEGDPKRDRLIAMLADWTPISELMSAMGWQAHTVRGALSTAAKVRGITIERRRVDGVTSYRVGPGAEAKAA